MNFKYKGAVVITTVLLLTGCGSAYDIMPPGTNDVPEITIAVPEEYRNVQSVGTGSTPVSDAVAEDSTGAEAAAMRLNLFEDAIQQDFYTNIKRVKTVGDNTQECELQFTFKGTKGCYKYFNSDGQMTTWVVSDDSGAYLIDSAGETVYTAEHFDLSTRTDFINAYSLGDAAYSRTMHETFESAELLCDVYTTADTTYKYYYDTADNLIVISKQRDGVQVHTLFCDFCTVGFDETVFEIPEYERQLYVKD